MRDDEIGDLRALPPREATVPLIQQILAEGPRLPADRLRSALAFLSRVRRAHGDAAVVAVADTAAGVLRVILRTSDWQTQMRDDEFASSKLRDRAVAVLSSGPKRPSELAEQLEVSSPEVVRALRPLRQAGRVEVTESGPAGLAPDARARWYRLVPTEPVPDALGHVEQLLLQGKRDAALDFLRSQDWTPVRDEA